MLVLQPTGEILMANPFSAVPTPFVAKSVVADGLAIAFGTLSASSPRFTPMVVCLPPAGLPAKRWSCRCATRCSLAEALSTSLSPHANGGKILSLIERPCFSSGRKRWWPAGAAIGVCHRARLSRLQPAGRWRVNGTTTQDCGRSTRLVQPARPDRRFLETELKPGWKLRGSQLPSQWNDALRRFAGSLAATKKSLCWEVWAGFTSHRRHNFEHRNYFNFAYSVFAAIRTGMSGSASFHSVRKS
jgi:hypothetical protein